MTPWMEEWRERTAHVIGEEEEESISMSLYEEKYRVVLRDMAALTDHGEGMMRQLGTANLGGNQFSGEEVASLRAKRDSTIEERDLIAEDLESLHHDFEGMRGAKDMVEAEMRKARDMAEVERDSIKDELERVRAKLNRVRAVPSSLVVVPTIPGPSPVLIEDLDRQFSQRSMP
ncbi:hypothetical protein AMTR_s00118p00111210 [Amborella trichopoda]|uniref:Uncharacterized protein n=1 Tax=Amborella trichopoda TaxID=13333 RepID=W1NNZ3_AMBTC|nr:hypothetical protein AMTR_s00118p00111210 [Amborella trichopoda]